jgi:dihydroorotate dehydrogenase
MSWFYRHCIRPALFTQNSEQIHNRTMRGLAWASRHKLALGALNTFYGASELPIELFGLRFPNPVGLAAGMDKAATAVPAWAALGFGFSELGGVTWHPQPGNPTPRIFRAIPDQALVNRMGFNNPGAEAVAQTLAKWRADGRWPNHPVGINLGKSKITPLEKAAEDYANSFRVLRQHADFFVVNVSSPNTPNLRQLQDKSALDEILAALQEVNVAASRKSAATPVLVKVAPDLSFEALDEILELVVPRQIAGIVATNTTITRPQTSDARLQGIYSEAGGLSGRPLRARSTEVIRHLHRQTRGTLPIIGVGGIFNADDAWEKIAAGASLVQVYTGLVYEGPGISKKIAHGLLKKLGQNGLKELRQAVGCEN